MLLGFVWSMAWVTVVFNITEGKGPAISRFFASGSTTANNPCTLSVTSAGKLDPFGNCIAGKEFIDAVAKSVLVTALWMICYNNYIGIAVMSVLTKGPWEVIDGNKLTDQFSNVASRFSGNRLEHAPVFLTTLWLYTLFCDYETAWCLGMVYIVSTAQYPFMYMMKGRFTFWFEVCTQLGYGVNGCYILGLLVQGTGNNWAKFANDNQIVAAILGFLVGTQSLLPGIPLTLPYLFVHWKMDQKRKLEEGSQVKEIEPVKEVEPANEGQP
jgi:hypothetical protein